MLISEIVNMTSKHFWRPNIKKNPRKLLNLAAYSKFQILPLGRNIVLKSISKFNVKSYYLRDHYFVIFKHFDCRNHAPVS